MNTLCTACRRSALHAHARTPRRPRALHASAQRHSQDAESPARRPRGRPRKQPSAEDTPATASRRRTTRASGAQDTLSAVARGTAFEHRTLALLTTALHMHHLTHTGGASDRGIDLAGWWYPPSDPDPDRVRVLVQCKDLGTPLGPVHVRELEGVLYRKAFEARMLAPRPQDQPFPPTHIVPLLGILASSAGFSTACARYAHACPLPLLLLHLQHPHPRFAALPNPALLAPTGIMHGRLVFRPTRTLGAQGGPRPEGALADPIATIDSPEILLDGRPLSSFYSQAEQ